MNEARFAPLACTPALCRCAGTGDRGSAARLLIGRLPPPLVLHTDTTAVVAPGRVHGLGRFADPRVHATLAAALPATLRSSLRSEFEWYACRGAFFHNDAHFGDVLFGAWCLAGPPREIVFARADVRCPAGPGDWVAFDPFEPHAVLESGASRYRRDHYEGAPVSLFLGFELELDEPVRQAFVISTAPAAAAVLASSVAINAETGALG